MAIPLSINLPSPGQPMSLPSALGISFKRNEQMKFIIEQMLKRPKGSYITDMQLIAKEATSTEELVYMTFQYGVSIGTNQAMAATMGVAKN